MIRILLATTLILLSSTAALADRQYHVVVHGMPCLFCLYGVEKDLSNLDDVAKVTSDLANGLFIVRLDGDASLSEETVREIVGNAGFTLQSFEEADDIPAE